MPPRQRIASGSAYETSVGFSRAVRVGDRVFVSGTAPIWPDGTCVPDVEAQMRRCCEIIVAALREADATPEDVVRTRVYVVDPSDQPAVGRVHAEVFGTAKPANTTVVARLLDPQWKVEIEAEAVVGDVRPPAGRPDSGGEGPRRGGSLAPVGRADLLETQVRLLSAAFGLRPDDPTAVVSKDVVDLARAGEQVKAIRVLRKQTGLGLAAAKRVVDAARSGTA